MGDDSPPIKRMSIAEFRSEGYLQEVNRLLLHPLGLALEVTAMGDGDDGRLIDQIALLVAENPRLVEFVEDETFRAELARELARTIVADMWPQGSEHISGVWDCRDDPGGMVYDAGVLDASKADRVGLLLADRLALRHGLHGFGVQPPTPTQSDVGGRPPGPPNPPKTQGHRPVA